MVLKVRSTKTSSLKALLIIGITLHAIIVRVTVFNDCDHPRVLIHKVNTYNVEEPSTCIAIKDCLSK